MIKLKFVHLRIYSEYSFVDGFIKLEELIKKVKSENHSTLAIIDNNLFGMVKFYDLCIKNNIKPIIGCIFSIKNKIYSYKPCNIILLSKNELGYKNLLKLINKANLSSQNNGFYEINKNWFKGNLNKGLIIIMPVESSEINYNFINREKSLVFKKLSFWKKYFNNRFYLEINEFNNKNDVYNYNIIKVSIKLKLPLIATHITYFLKKKDFLLYKIKNCISTNEIINKKKFINKKYKFYIKKKKFNNLFKIIPSSLINSYILGKKCNFFINSDKIDLPIFYNKLNNNKYIIKLALNLLKLNKFINIYNNHDLYKKRVLTECITIIKIGLADYFLIVYDFIRWAKKNNIPVGPGRGSSAGSLISYLFNITTLDPIKYNLIFERFLNPKRVSMPDFDIDFCPIKRHKVIFYIKKKYGISSICQIVTFGKIASKASIRDIGRVLNYNYLFIDKIVKLISFKESFDSITNIIKVNQNLKYRYNNESNVKTIINLAIKLENSIKNIGIHASGILISTDKIYNSFPLYIQNNTIISQYSKDDIEKLGILKFDFLGLKTLTIINDCFKTIRLYNKKKHSIKNLNLNDKFCYLKLKLAKTNAVFQLESFGMQKLLKKLKPNSFNNIIALISLYRPGPINLIEDFCQRKFKKKKIIYLDKRLEPVLKETYGIIIYQEQIMYIAKIISNFSLENADLLRLAISKKKSNEMLKQKFNFIKNGISNGFDRDFLLNLFNKIEKFAEYGFNKSHAAAYAILSYQTIWIKSYYYILFMTLNMSYCLSNSIKLKYLINDCMENNVFILPININESLYNFYYYNKNKIKKIRYGFSSVKGLGEIMVKNIIKIRDKSNFKNFMDFINRAYKYINKKIVEVLICAGAFDSIELNRANILLKYKNYLNKINCKTTVYWHFITKSKEEKLKLGFFYINNVYNIYKCRYNSIKLKISYKIKNKYISGVIIDIQNFYIDQKQIYFILILTENSVFKIKIDNFVYDMNLDKLKIFNFIIIIYIFNKHFFEGRKIYNIEDFCF